MKSNLCLITLAASLSIASPAMAAGTARELLALCSTVQEGRDLTSANEAGCILYVGGFLAGIKYGAGNAMYRLISRQGKSYKELTLAMEASRREAQCVPNSATAPQVARVFVRFAEANPIKLDQPDTTLLSEAINEHFNCVLTRTP